MCSSSSWSGDRDAVAGLKRHVISEFERGIVFRRSRLRPPTRGPGLTLVVPVVDQLDRVNKQHITMPVRKTVRDPRPTSQLTSTLSSASESSIGPGGHQCLCGSLEHLCLQQREQFDQSDDYGT